MRIGADLSLIFIRENPPDPRYPRSILHKWQLGLVPGRETFRSGER